MGGDRGHHILEGLADGERKGGDLAGDLEQAGGDRSALSGEEEVEDEGARVGQQPAGGVGGEQGEAGGDQEADVGFGDGRPDEAPEVVIAAEQGHAEHSGEGERAEMGEDEADASGAEREPAQSEENPGDLLPEQAEADLGPEGPAGAGGRGRDLDEGPQGQAPGEQGDGGGQARLVLGRGGEEAGDPIGVPGDEQGNEGGGKDGEEEGGLDRAVGGLVVLGRDDALKRAGQQQIDDVLEEIDARPERHIEAVGGQAVEADVERLGDRVDQSGGPGEAGEAGAARDFAAGDILFRVGGGVAAIGACFGAARGSGPAGPRARALRPGVRREAPRSYNPRPGRRPGAWPGRRSGRPRRRPRAAATR